MDTFWNTCMTVIVNICSRFVYLSDGQPINELATDWSEGEPNNFLHSHPPFELDEDGVNSVPFLEGKWNDIPEHFTYHVVCEIIW